MVKAKQSIESLVDYFIVKNKDCSIRFGDIKGKGGKVLL